MERIDQPLQTLAEMVTRSRDKKLELGVMVSPKSSTVFIRRDGKQIEGVTDVAFQPEMGMTLDHCAEELLVQLAAVQLKSGRYA